MAYVIAGICVAICVIIIIFGLRVLRDTRNLKMRKDDEDESSLRRR